MVIITKTKDNSTGLLDSLETALQGDPNQGYDLVSFEVWEADANYAEYADRVEAYIYRPGAIGVGLVKGWTDGRSLTWHGRIPVCRDFFLHADYIKPASGNHLMLTLCLAEPSDPR